MTLTHLYTFFSCPSCFLFPLLLTIFFFDHDETLWIIVTQYYNSQTWFHAIAFMNFHISWSIYFVVFLFCFWVHCQSIFSFLFTDIVLLIWLSSIKVDYYRYHLRLVILQGIVGFIYVRFLFPLLVNPVIVQPTLWWRWTSYLLFREPHRVIQRLKNA
jgi:hypothetical protein